MGIDDVTEQSRLLDRIAARIMPELERKLGEAYIYGSPYFVRYGYAVGGMTVDVIPADEFYIQPDISTERT